MSIEPQLEALRRLWKVANGHSGQCEVIATFLLALYNAYRFHFDLTNLRRLDSELVRDVLIVLALDSMALKEVQSHLGVGNDEFERLATAWGVRDYMQQVAP